MHLLDMAGFPEIRATMLGVPIIRTIAFWGPRLGSPYLWKLPYVSPQARILVVRLPARSFWFQILGATHSGFRVLGFRLLGFWV